MGAGETVFSISNKFGILEQALRDANNIKGNHIEIGQRLVIPRPPRIAPKVLATEADLPGIESLYAHDTAMHHSYFAYPLTRTLYIVVLGIDTLRLYRQYSLKYARKNAEDVLSGFMKQEGILYKKVVPLLIDGNSSKQSIIAQIAAFCAQIKNEDDSFVFYIGGHAVINPDDNKTFRILTSSYDMDGDTTNHQDAILSSEIVEAIKTPNAPLAKKIVFLDVCHPQAFSLAFASEAIDKMDICVIAAAGIENDIVIERDAWKGTAFCLALISALNGQSDRVNARGSIFNLFKHLEQEVYRMTDGKQRPKIVVNFIQKNREEGSQLQIMGIPVDESAEDKPTDVLTEKPTGELMDKPTDVLTEKPTGEPAEKPLDESIDTPPGEPRKKPAAISKTQILAPNARKQNEEEY